MDPIPLEDLALMDVLHRIFHGEESAPVEPEMRRRLIDSALIEEDGDALRLTDAGVAMCKSLQHRVEADKRAGKILDKRDA